MRNLLLSRTLCSIWSLCQRHFLYLKPHGLGVADFLENISWGSKLAVLVSQRNYLQKLVKMGMITPEVSTLSSKIVGGGDADSDPRRIAAWGARIMKERIKNSEWEIIKVRRKLSKSSCILRKSLTQEIFSEFMAAKQDELQQVWSNERRHRG